jgi:hypothetical protein
MEHRARSFPLRVVTQDVVLALFVTVMQVQGTVARVAAEGHRARSPTSQTSGTRCWW